MSLWGYVSNFRDTDFGGKTGTSNNHSDAWFMAVSPRLVCGAWVGGEYRSIHFRTGALGQGSRTALPICGYFLQSVLGDPAFKKYHGRFDKPNQDDITGSMYNCQSYYPHARVDTTARDSVSHSEEILLDENGNPIITPVEGNRKSNEENGSSKTPELKKKPREEAVNFDNL